MLGPIFAMMLLFSSGTFVLSTMLEYLFVLWNGGSGDPKLSVFPWMHMLVRHLPIRPAEKPDQIGSEHDEEESWQPV